MGTSATRRRHFLWLLFDAEFRCGGESEDAALVTDWSRKIRHEPEQDVTKRHDRASKNASYQITAAAIIPPPTSPAMLNASMIVSDITFVRLERWLVDLLCR